MCTRWRSGSSYSSPFRSSVLTGLVKLSMSFSLAKFTWASSGTGKRGSDGGAVGGIRCVSLRLRASAGLMLDVAFRINPLRSCFRKPCTPDSA